jgi:hypothetical protein
MTVFRIVSALAIVALLGAVVYDLRRRGMRWYGITQFVRDQARHDVRTLAERKNAGRVGSLNVLRRIAFGVSSAFLLVLALTGFVPVLILNQHLSGVLLIVHVTIAPLFALSLSAAALLWAYRLGFDEVDWHCLVALWTRQSPRQEMLVRFAMKVAFWLLLLISLPLMLTVILGLFPLFGTEGEELLIRWHGYSALLLALVALAEIYLTIVYLHHSKEGDS